MNRTVLACLLMCSSHHAWAGDDASGPIAYSADLSAPFTVYRMSERDKAWSRSLVVNLKYKGRVVHFVRTSLPLSADEKMIEGAIYQAIEEPEVFYVASGDAMLRIGAPHPVWVGTSFHAPRSRNFIVCLDFAKDGIPFLSSSAVTNGKVRWYGHDWNRVKSTPPASPTVSREHSPQ